MDEERTETWEEALERVRARREVAARGRQRKRRLLSLLSLAFAGLLIVAVASVITMGGGSSEESVAVEPEGTAKASSNDRESARVEDAQRGGPDWRSFRGPVPILMYHPIEDPVPGNPYPDLFLTKQDFVDQIRWLKGSGYEAVTLTEVLDSWFGKGKLPPKPVVLSFDDGYVSQYENAFPVMERLDWPGILNLKAEDSDIYDRQVEEMVAGGWEIASHTVTHPDLPSISDSQLTDELVESRKILEREFDTQVNNFCYPAGRYDDRVIAAVRKAGYRSATSTEPGLARPSDRWSLDRIRIELGDGAAELESKLASAGA